MRLRESRRSALVGKGWEREGDRRPCVGKRMGSGEKNMRLQGMDGERRRARREWVGSGERSERSEKGAASAMIRIARHGEVLEGSAICILRAWEA